MTESQRNGRQLALRFWKLMEEEDEGSDRAGVAFALLAPLSSSGRSQLSLSLSATEPEDREKPQAGRLQEM